MILLLGANGYVGGEFSRQLTSQKIPFKAFRRHECELQSPGDLAKYLDLHQVSTLINCIGYTGKPNVDACEAEKAKCLAGNAVLPGMIAQACAEVGIPWGHVSSGCIYTGKKLNGMGFDETDPPNFSFRQNNCSFYSGTKALGEEVLSSYGNCYIWRLRIPFSNIDSNRNFLSKLLRYETLLEAENSLSNLPEFVTAALDCFWKQIPYGIYNLTNPGSIKTSEVAQLLNQTGVSNREFRFFKSEEEFMHLAAKTPRSNCVLDTSKALSAGLEMTDIRKSLPSSLENWIPEACLATSQSR